MSTSHDPGLLMEDMRGDEHVSQALLPAEFSIDSELPEEALLDEPCEPVDPARVARLVQTHHSFVWRSLRRLGVVSCDVDDATQKVFLAVSRKLGKVPPHRERSFLFATAIRIASNERRAERRKRHAGTEDIDLYMGGGASPEQTIADRALLDKVLDPLPLKLRSVFILFELEQMTKNEIAATLDLPEGTVASRLRRARELVEATIARLRAGEAGVR
ncbi:RNA polymerase sigma factor [Pendulispora albinea]|uniref:RNA polymerase sigma factor n=1 Tax=Pendulispora albinea TaxID=2741071 RepID=A0ABZ2LTL3_9BACT